MGGGAPLPTTYYLLPHYPQLGALRHPQIGHHSPIGSAGSAMTIEVPGVVGGAPFRNRHGADPQKCRLLGQHRAQVQMPGPGAFGRFSTAFHDFRTYFIAVTANPYTTVHYQISWITSRSFTQGLDSLGKDTTGSSPPTGVQQSNGLLHRIQQVNRNAVGDGDSEQNALC